MCAFQSLTEMHNSQERDNYNMNIFVVDDEKLTRRGIISNIKSNGYKNINIIEAKNGAEALEKSEKEPPSIVITDRKSTRLNSSH